MSETNGGRAGAALDAGHAQPVYFTGRFVWSETGPRLAMGQDANAPAGVNPGDEC